MSDTKVLGKADLLEGASLRRELVPIPSANASIWMRELSSEHVIGFKRFVDALKAGGTTETTIEQDIEITTMVISYSACDKDGNLLFDTPEEAKTLTKYNGVNTLLDLSKKALEISKIKLGHNGLSSEVADNLPNAQETSSPSALPMNSKKRKRK